LVQSNTIKASKNFIQKRFHAEIIVQVEPLFTCHYDCSHSHATQEPSDADDDDGGGADDNDPPNQTQKVGGNEQFLPSN